VLHGTTIATNAILEYNGAVTGMVTTEGYRDILHIGRHQRPQHYSIMQDIPWQDRPLVWRRHRKTVPERLIPPRGEVLIPLDEAAVRQAARELQAAGVQAIAVCFLFSYLNAQHEERARDIILEEYPQCFGLCRKVGFWRQNPKSGSRKINHLRVSTFLFSVICDRASWGARAPNCLAVAAHNHQRAAPQTRPEWAHIRLMANFGEASFSTFPRIAWWSVAFAHRRPPEVRMCRLSIQSCVGTRPPSTSTPHCPACWARR
jgi:Hydantoinase/oxoprolinase N-terminal region